MRRRLRAGELPCGLGLGSELGSSAGEVSGGGALCLSSALVVCFIDQGGSSFSVWWF